MALIKCVDCGHDVSDTAKTCPHCGYDYQGNPVTDSEGSTMFLFTMLLIMGPAVMIGTIYNDSLGGYGIGLGFLLGAVLTVGFMKWNEKRNAKKSVVENTTEAPH